jgi:hypothetical protein
VINTTKDPSKSAEKLAPKSPDRLCYGLAMAITILAGLASRRGPGLFPQVFGKYPGDSLWATMVFFGLRALLLKSTNWRIAGYALGIAYAVEFLKLYQAPWIVAVRYSTLGHLVFGHVFSWQNLIAYAVGVVIGLGIDFLVRRLLCHAKS